MHNTETATDCNSNDYIKTWVQPHFTDASITDYNVIQSVPRKHQYTMGQTQLNYSISSLHSTTECTELQQSTLFNKQAIVYFF